MEALIALSDQHSISYGAFKPRKPHCFRGERAFQDPDITITVFASASPSPRHNFIVDRETISTASPYFQKLLSPKSSVAHFNHIDLVDENPEAFRLVLTCLTTDAGRPLACDLKQRQWPAARLSRTAVDVLAYILALKFGMDTICNQIMDRILHQHEVTDVYNGALDGKTISDFPDCKVTKFLIEQLAWDLAKIGARTFCECNENTRSCSPCKFVLPKTAASERVYTGMKMYKQGRVKGTLDESEEPWRKGHCYWHIHGYEEGKGVSCPAGKTYGKCVKEQDELDLEMASQAPGRGEGLAAKLEIQKDEIQSKYATVSKEEIDISKMNSRGTELRLEALSLNDLAGELSGAATTATEDDVLSASDFGDFEAY
jgi:hypothetical protein